MGGPRGRANFRVRQRSPGFKAHFPQLGLWDPGSPPLSPSVTAFPALLACREVSRGYLACHPTVGGRVIVRHRHSVNIGFSHLVHFGRTRALGHEVVATLTGLELTERCLCWGGARQCFGSVRTEVQKEDTTAEVGVWDHVDIVTLRLPFPLIATFPKRCPENFLSLDSDCFHVLDQPDKAQIPQRGTPPAFIR